MSRYALLIIVSVIWGSSFLLNEWAIEGFTPLQYAFMRIAIGCLCLTVYLNLPGLGSGSRRYPVYGWVMFFLIGLFEAALPLYLVAWGQQYITSAEAVIIMGLAPIFTLVLANLFIPGEHINHRTIYSVMVGFLGLLVMLSPKLHSGDFFMNIAGELAVLGAGLAFAISIIFIKKLPHDYEPVSLIRNVLFCAALQLLPIIMITEYPIHFEVNYRSMVAVVIAGVLPSSLAYPLYVILLRRETATFASMINFLVPLTGILLGVTILGEDPEWTTYYGMAMILTAVAAAKPVAEGHT